jgi:hypothetical protein
MNMSFGRCKPIEGVSEPAADENIWTYDGGYSRKQEILPKIELRNFCSSQILLG